MLLDAAGVQHHPGRRRPPQLGGLFDARRRHAGDVGRPRRCHLGDGRGGLVEVDGVGIDELVVEPVAFDQDVQHRAEQRRVGPGPHRKEQISGAGERDDARVLDDQLGATVTGLQM